MAEDKLKIRSQIKKRKPTFKRTQTNQFAKFKKDGYRKPKGMGNKIRRSRRGHIRLPQVGFSSPKEVRGMNSAGLKEVIVSTLKELEGINPKKETVVISRTVGSRKRLEILIEVKKNGLTVSNYKDIDTAIKALTKEKKEVKKKKQVKAEDKTQEVAEDKKEDSKEETKTKSSESKKSEEDQK